MAAPKRRGPAMLKVTPMTAKIRTTTIRGALGSELAEEPGERAPEVARLAAHPRPHHAEAGTPAGATRRPGPKARRAAGRPAPAPPGDADRTRRARDPGRSGRSRDLLRGQLRVDDLAIGVAAAP